MLSSTEQPVLNYGSVLLESFSSLCNEVAQAFSLRIHVDPVGQKSNTLNTDLVNRGRLPLLYDLTIRTQGRAFNNGIIQILSGHCTDVEVFNVTCTADGYELELGITNHLAFDFGQVQLTYQGSNGPIVQLVTGVSLGAFMASPLNVTLDPNVWFAVPFCMDMVFFQAGNAGEWLECCHLEACTELPLCENISGCTDPDAINYNPNATLDDGSCLWNNCIVLDLMDPNYPCTDEYEPVCGCDGATYGNACYAMRLGGVISWTQGECGNSNGQNNSNDCATDVNADGTTNVMDLLLVFDEFGSECD